MPLVCTSWNMLSVGKKRESNGTKSVKRHNWVEAQSSIHLEFRKVSGLLHVFLIFFNFLPNVFFRIVRHIHHPKLSQLPLKTTTNTTEIVSYIENFGDVRPFFIYIFITSYWKLFLKNPVKKAFPQFRLQHLGTV